MEYERIIEYTDIDLRNEATPEQVQYLKDHPDQWAGALRTLKCKAERQMTSHKTRVFDLYVTFQKGIIDNKTYNEKLSEEKGWKVNANRFLQAIEIKIMESKYNANQ